jgi:hypothetical protein
MSIFALFFCVQTTCTMQGGGQTYGSLVACQRAAAATSGLITPPTNGRYGIPNGGWFECRSKHVDTWEPVR